MPSWNKEHKGRRRTPRFQPHPAPREVSSASGRQACCSVPGPSRLSGLGTGVPASIPPARDFSSPSLPVCPGINVHPTLSFSLFTAKPHPFSHPEGVGQREGCLPFGRSSVKGDFTPHSFQSSNHVCHTVVTCLPLSNPCIWTPSFLCSHCVFLRRLTI